ncbi:NAD(P)H-dependent oxidoreductase [Williamsoniiplasma luminosum]|uniref:NAD(P)H-dependent oxidoreductase n=1 Tax=Williamsoniiplasma luminosum TaxID=214888 RepID=A0A2K8NWR9_9MOLU|nr:nitroreductase family protein [Williamsoniiplasma luminosum]ATZ17181.1 NAD(P)H-dependent oxidoreductase [Williamsoniiplasma luminosum]
MFNKTYVLDLIKNRRATKRMVANYTISDEDLRVITESMRWTSMSYGVWSYRILVVPKGELRDALTPAFMHQPSFINSSHVILLISSKEEFIRNQQMAYSFDHAIPEHAANVRQDRFKAVFNNWEMNKVVPEEWSSKQTYIALGSAMITAAHLGIDSAPYEGFNRFEIDKILEKYQLIDQKNERLSVAIGFGKADLNDKMVHFFDKTRMDEDKFTIIVNGDGRIN